MRLRARSIHRATTEQATTLTEGVGTMAVGPVQLIVLGFAHPEFRGEILDELQRLREADTIRVIDALAVYKDKQGEVAILEMSNLTTDEQVELGAKIGALVGIGAFGDDDEAVEEMALAGAETAAEEGVGVFSAEQAWDVVEDIPQDTAALLLMIEHHWAVPLRDAVARANGFRIADGFVSPYDLVAIGIMTAEDAKANVAVESG
jgi:uncharacterized membrane protein